jgi:Ni,Fe-hydrogenase III component G
MGVNESGLISMLRDNWGSLIDIQNRGKRRIFAKITKENCRVIADFLRRNFCARLITIEIFDSESLFEIIYYFDIQGIVLSLTISTAKLTPQIYTISDIIPSAVRYEKEIADSFNLTFINADNVKYRQPN